MYAEELNQNSNWLPFDFVDANSILIFYNTVNGEGTYSDNAKSEQEIGAFITLEFNESYNKYALIEISFDIEPLNKARSLRNTWLDREESGTLALIDSTGKKHDFNVKIKPGKIVNAVLREHDQFQLASLLQRHDTFQGTIRGDNGEWFCDFNIDGYWVPPNYAEPEYQAGTLGGVLLVARLAPWIAKAGRALIRTIGKLKDIIRKKPKSRPSPTSSVPKPGSTQTPPASKPPTPRPPINTTGKDRIIEKTRNAKQKDFNDQMSNGIYRERNWKEYVRDEIIREQQENGPLPIPPGELEEFINDILDIADSQVF